MISICFSPMYEQSFMHANFCLNSTQELLGQQHQLIVLSHFPHSAEDQIHIPLPGMIQRIFKNTERERERELPSMLAFFFLIPIKEESTKVTK